MYTYILCILKNIHIMKTLMGIKHSHEGEGTPNLS